METDQGEIQPGNKEEFSDSENNQPMEQALPSEIVGASSLEAFKKRLDCHFSETVWCLLLGQGVGLDDLQGPFQLC